MSAVAGRLAKVLPRVYADIMNILGSGPTLIVANPWLRDPAERHRQILDVAERNSVIEGLPPFSAAVRAQILAQLQAATPRDSVAGPREPGS